MIIVIVVRPVALSLEMVPLGKVVSIRASCPTCFRVVFN